MHKMKEVFNGFPTEHWESNFLHMFYVKGDCGTDPSTCYDMPEGT